MARNADFFDEWLQNIEREDEEEKVQEIKRRSEEIVSCILDPAYRAVDIQIKMDALRDTITAYFPEKSYLYDLIYESRFKRIREQFRGGAQE